jgi:hypothetical protein
MLDSAIDRQARYPAFGAKASANDADHITNLLSAAGRRLQTCEVSSIFVL